MVILCNCQAAFVLCLLKELAEASEGEADDPSNPRAMCFPGGQTHDLQAFLLGASWPNFSLLDHAKFFVRVVLE